MCFSSQIFSYIFAFCEKYYIILLYLATNNFWNETVKDI